MKMTDQEIRQAVDHRLSALDDDPTRRARTLQRIRNEEPPRRKKKLSAGLVIALVILLTLAGVALALTTNLFTFFGQRDERYGKIAGLAALETSAPVQRDDTQTDAINAKFDSAFYDGLTLNAAILIEQPRRVEPYMPEDSALSAMEVAQDIPLPDPEEAAPGEADAQLAMQAAQKAGTPYGYQVISYSPSDHVLTDDGIDIPPYAGDPTVDENGNAVEMREFETPLPEELQNLNAITLNCTLCRNRQLWYFDGQTLYYQNVNEEAGSIRAVVPRSNGMTQSMRGAYTFGGVTYAVTAQVSTMSAAVTLEGDGLTTLRDFIGSGAEVPAGTDPTDVWVNMTAYDKQGREYLSEGGFSPDQTLPVTCVFMGVGELPQSLDLHVFLEWEGDTGSGSQPLILTLMPVEPD